MTTLRLIADDLTGALDTAAEFVGLTGPVPVFWHGTLPPTLPANAAIDLGTREAGAALARAATTAATPSLAGAGIAFKKIDSLMRGQTLVELAACFRAGTWAQAVLAPAFPFQGRVTRQGQQFMRTGAGWDPAGPELVAALRTLDVPAQTALGGALPPGITVFDAETDADLDQVVAQAGGAGAPVLWCGTGGLARALAASAPAAPSLPGPVLGLFGSDQAVTAAQLAQCQPHWIKVRDGGAESAARIARALAQDGVALVTLDLPPGLARAEAAVQIERAFGALAGRLPIPGTLAVAGGETLRALCGALGATSLDVQGRAVPGVPVSVLRGGAWDGVTVVSKSGAFGQPGLLRGLLRIPQPERTSL